uniref:Uncharacterized protein n=1 Tax=Cannabis sativa TaxID=3483 RepID=A0A803QKH2_CANSA
MMLPLLVTSSFRIGRRCGRAFLVCIPCPCDHTFVASPSSFLGKITLNFAKPQSSNIHDLEKAMADWEGHGQVTFHEAWSSDIP